MISFKNREELVDFVERCAGSESPADDVDVLIEEMKEAGEITVFSLHAMQRLKQAGFAASAMGETAEAGVIDALAGIGYAILSGNESAEAFYAIMAERGR